MRVLWTIVGVLLLANPAYSAGTQWLRESPREFLEGEMDGVIYDAAGRLMAAPVAATRYGTDSFFVWSVAEDRKGRIVAGTGDGGVLFREADDELVPWASTLALEILSLLPWGDGVLAGTSPDGVVYQVEEDGSLDVALDIPQQSIWDLELGSESGSWLAAAGPGARILRVSDDTPAGEALHTLDATNATGLLRDEGGLWIATQGPALLLRIEGDDRQTPRLVYESSHEEIRGLVADGDGGVVVLAVTLIPANGSGEAEEKKKETEVCRITWHPRDGGVETIYTGSEPLLSLLAQPDGSFLAGQAKNGRVLRIDRQGRRSLWIDLDDADPIALTRRQDGTVLVGTANVGTVFALGDAPGDQGTYTSSVLEAKNLQRWGRLWADGATDEVTFQSRSGVRGTVDETWSEWSDPAPVGRGVASPVAPYLQIRLSLAASSTVTQYAVAYTERNLAPRVLYVKVEAPGGELKAGRPGSSPSKVSQRFDDGLEVEYSIHQERAPTEAENTAWARGLRSVVWKSEDPNQDKIHHRVQMQRLPDGPWHTLIEDHPERVYGWDTRAVADGRYRIRVVADDTYQNSVTAAREGTATSDVVHVDNTPPVVGRVRESGETLSVQVSDDGSPLTAVSVRGPADRWRPLDADDGVLDGREESFSFGVPTASVWLRAVDAAGNVTVQELRP